MRFGRVEAWVGQRGVHGLARGGEDVCLVGGAVRLEVFFAPAGDAGLCAGGGGGVREVGEEAEVLGFVAQVGVGGVCGVVLRWVFVEISHFYGFGCGSVKVVVVAL